VSKYIIKKSTYFGFFLLGGILMTGTPAAAQGTKVLKPLDLDATKWEVEVVYMNAKGKKEQSTDTLIFEDEEFFSEKYKRKGFEPTNYATELVDGDVTSFGTMQTKGNESAFWKGKIEGQKINGSIHVQRPEGGNVNYYFSGALTEGYLVRQGEPKPQSVALPLPPPVNVQNDSQAQQAPEVSENNMDMDEKEESPVEAVKEDPKPKKEKKKWF